jgi:hypothetical protein
MGYFHALIEYFYLLEGKILGVSATKIKKGINYEW